MQQLEEQLASQQSHPNPVYGLQYMKHTHTYVMSQDEVPASDWRSTKPRTVGFRQTHLRAILSAADGRTTQELGVDSLTVKIFMPHSPSNPENDAKLANFTKHGKNILAE